MSHPLQTAKGLQSTLRLGAFTASAALFGLVILTPSAQAQIVINNGWRAGASNGGGTPQPPSQAPIQGRQYVQGVGSPSNYQPQRSYNASPIVPSGGMVNGMRPGGQTNAFSQGPIVNSPGNWMQGPGYQQSPYLNRTSPIMSTPVQSLPSTAFPQRVYSNNPQLLRAGRPVQRTAPNGPPIQGSIQVMTPVGQRRMRHPGGGGNYIYAPVTDYGGPTLLGGYYYGGYCDASYGGYTYPSIYGGYDGLPEYICNPGVIVLGQPYYPDYATSYMPFSPPSYQVTYNQTNYYVAGADTAQQIEQGGSQAQRALQTAAPEDSYQAAFADIERAWANNDLTLLRSHIRDADTKLSVYSKGKYSYSIASGDFLQITRDAFDRLSTVSFQFTRLRKAKNGDVTAYGKHVYKSSGTVDTTNDQATAGDTVPFSTDESQPYAKADDPSAGVAKTVYVSYTLRKHDDQWYIIGVDSSPNDLVK